MKIISFASALLLSLPLWAGALDRAFLRGTCDHADMKYARGETMTFTIRLTDVEGEPEPGQYVAWERTGDDGERESGRVPLTREPLVVATSLDRPGYVRIVADAMNADGTRIVKNDPSLKYDAKYLAFNGGACVEPENIVGCSEPNDFDAFWAKRKARLAALPMKAEMLSVAGTNEAVSIYAVTVNCAGARPVTGYLTVPNAPGKFPAQLRMDGYEKFSMESAIAPTDGPADRINFHINAHGYELGREEEYYREFYTSIKSGGCDYAFDARQNADAEQAYFSGMSYRVMRAIQFLKTQEKWNGKDLWMSGGSQGGLQALWGGALDAAVTEVRLDLNPWCCDLAGFEQCGRNCGDWRVSWTEALGYYDAAHHAKRIGPQCRVSLTRLGMGDYVCPPSGTSILWNNLKCPKRFVWTQGMTHGYTPPEPRQERVDEEKW